MSIANSETSTSSSSRVRVRDTGFPESFCGNRNTRLPHPDADTSPNACISQEDISVSRVLSRHRRSFLPKSKRTISHGHITPEMEQMYSDANATSDPDNSPVLVQDARLSGNHPVRPSSGGANSFNSTSTGDREDAAPKSPNPNRHTRQRSSISSTGRGRRRSFMERLGLHRHHE